MFDLEPKDWTEFIEKHFEAYLWLSKRSQENALKRLKSKKYLSKDENRRLSDLELSLVPKTTL